jgi:cob(I)alamin adenosyltransferase
MQRGLVQIYTGNGKGKTTAALGLALRAVGGGLKVYLGQFIKKGSTCEIKALRRFYPDIIVRQYGRGCFIKGKPSPADILSAQMGLKDMNRAMCCGKYDLVIADEIICALNAGLVSTKDILQLIGKKPVPVELVLTGRDAPASIIKRADLVTEMRKVRHPFDRGFSARKGIEY